MCRLAAILHLFIGTTLAGAALIVALVTGHVTVGGLIGAAVVGFVGSLPVTYFVARALFTD
jgi:hypothetical protein